MNCHSKSIYAVARKAGCSPSTVSRVLTNSARVKPDTRSRILNAMREMKFIARKRVPQIGIVVSNLSGARLTSYVSQLLRLVMLELVKRNCVIRVLNGENRMPENNDNFDAFISLAYDESVNHIVKNSSAPVISLNNPLAAENFYNIYSNHRQSARIATEYLLTMGHRNIMMIGYKKSCGSIGDWGMLERTSAFSETLQRFGRRSDLIAYTNDEPLENILLRARAEGVTGIVAFSEDELHIPYLLSHVMKMRLPEEMSLVMEELPDVLNFTVPPVTAIKQPFPRMIDAIMSRLDKLLAGDHEQCAPVVFNNELVIRDSVARIGEAIRPPHRNDNPAAHFVTA